MIVHSAQWATTVLQAFKKPVQLDFTAIKPVKLMYPESALEARTVQLGLSTHINVVWGITAQRGLKTTLGVLLACFVIPL